MEHAAVLVRGQGCSTGSTRALPTAGYEAPAAPLGRKTWLFTRRHDTAELTHPAVDRRAVPQRGDYQ